MMLTVLIWKRVKAGQVVFICMVAFLYIPEMESKGSKDGNKKQHVEKAVKAS